MSIHYEETEAQGDQAICPKTPQPVISVSPLDGQTFALKTMSVDTANNKMTVGIPATIATAGRQVLLQYSTDSTFATIAGSTVVTAGATTADVPLPESGAVYYCRLLATVAQ